ncbi:unnamed protein product [Sphagnum jensenii]
MLPSGCAHMSWPTESIVIHCSEPSSTTVFNVTPSANIRWTYSTRSIEGCGLRSHILDTFGYRVSVEVLQRDIAKSDLSLLGSCKSSLATDCEEQRSAVESSSTARNIWLHGLHRNYVDHIALKKVPATKIHFVFSLISYTSDVKVQLHIFTKFQAVLNKKQLNHN